MAVVMVSWLECLPAEPEETGSNPDNAKAFVALTFFLSAILHTVFRKLMLEKKTIFLQLKKIFSKKDLKPLEDEWPARWSGDSSTAQHCLASISSRQEKKTLLSQIEE